MFPYEYYIMGMNTFDELSSAIRSGYNNPDAHPAAKVIGQLLGKFASGIAIGAGIALAMAIARAGGM
jgi:hypothetical protein